MKQLIKIQTNTDGKKAVSAREMYVGLGLEPTHWKRWANRNIEKNSYAVEGVDWVGFALMANGNETKDYILNLDFAKKLCMQVRTDKGEQIRNYFLEVEKVAMGISTHQTVESARLAEIEAKLHRLESLAVGSHVTDYSIMGYARLCKKNICLNEANALGKRATKQCKELGLSIGHIRDSRYGLVNTYPEQVLEQVFREFFSRPRF